VPNRPSFICRLLGSQRLFFSLSADLINSLRALKKCG